MQHDVIMNCSFGYQNIFLLFYSASEENKYLILSPFSEIFFFSEKNYFTINVFSLFAGDDVKTSDLELYFCKISTRVCWKKFLRKN